MKKFLFSLLAVAAAGSMLAAVTPHLSLEAGYDHGNMRLRNFNYYGPTSTFFENGKMDGFHVGGNVQLDFLEGQHKPGLLIGLNYQFLANNIASWDQETKAVMNSWKETASLLGGKNTVATDYAYMHTLQIPIRVVYTYQINNDSRFFLLTGPQIRLHVAMEERTNMTTILPETSKKSGSTVRDEYVSGISTASVWVDGKESQTQVYMRDQDKFNCFDMSWGFGLGYGWRWFSLGITYDLGMINLVNKDAVRYVNQMYNQNLRWNSDALTVTLGFRLK